MDGFNFMTDRTPQRTSKKRHTPRHKGIFWYGSVFVGTALVILLGISVYGAGTFFAGASSGQDSLQEAQDAAMEFDIESAASHLEDARVEFESARIGLTWLSWIRIVPWAGRQYEAVTLVTDAGIEALYALEEATDIAEDVTSILEEVQVVLEAADVPEDEYTFDHFPEEMRAQILQTLHQQHGRLVEMQVRLELSQERLEELDQLTGVSPFIVKTVDPFKDILPNILAGVDVLVPLSATVDELAGVEDERQWLVLFLNNTEMRPAGGFMGVYGLMSIKDAEIQNMQVADTYSVDQRAEEQADALPLAPAPITHYIGTEHWYFRDANWSPDFRVSAQEATNALQREVELTGQPAPHIDGVIGFTPTFAESILEVVGPVTVDGIEFSSENVTELLEFEVEFGYEDRGIDFEQRKALVGKLTQAVIKEIYELPVTEWGSLFQIIQEDLVQKQLAIYSFDKKTQAAFEDADWSSGVDIGNAIDQLFVVDANMHALKTDASIDRSIEYRIQPDGDGYVATVQAKYTHFGAYDLFTSDYKSYTRVYMPIGSEILSSNQEQYDVAEELGMMSIGTYFEVVPGETKTIEYTYRLPVSITDAINKNLYELVVIKQMGADNFPLTLDLDFGKKVRAAYPGEENKYFGDNKYNMNTDLVQDTFVRVQF